MTAEATATLRQAKSASNAPWLHGWEPSEPKPLLRRLSKRLSSAPAAATNRDGASGWLKASPGPLLRQPKLPWWPRDRACPMTVDSNGTCGRSGGRAKVNTAA